MFSSLVFYTISIRLTKAIYFADYGCGEDNSRKKRSADYTDPGTNGCFDFLYE